MFVFVVLFEESVKTFDTHNVVNVKRSVVIVGELFFVFILGGGGGNPSCLCWFEVLGSGAIHISRRFVFFFLEFRLI